MKMKRRAAALLAGVTLSFQASHVLAATMSLSDLISSGGDITVGDLSIGDFLATPQNTVDPTTIEVSTVVDGLGHAGLQFSAPISIAGRGGSNEIVADFLFTVTETTPASTLHDLTQAFTASVSGSGIAAFDFTRAGPVGGALSTLAGNCINGDAVGCPQITPVTDTGLMGDVATDQVEREVQLVRSRGGSGTGDLTSWSVSFGEAAETSPVPEPSTWLLMAMGVGALGAIGRRRSGWRRANMTAA